MSDLKDLAREILSQGYLMSLATIDESGPWVSDVIYVFDDKLNIYWLSSVETRHSKALAADSRAAATVTISNSQGEDNVGLQIEGKAQAIEGDILAMAIQHRQKSGKPAPTNEGEMLDPGKSWYRLKPSKIEIIHQPSWGFKKKALEL